MRDRGRHNQSKAKTLMVLYEQEVVIRAQKPHYEYWNGFSYVSGMTARDIHWRSGVPLATLVRSLGRWQMWELIEGFPVLASGSRDLDSRQAFANLQDRPIWAYRISEKGISWLRNYAHGGLNLGRFESEMLAFRAENPDKQLKTLEDALEFFRASAGVTKTD